MNGGESGEKARKISYGEVLSSYLWLLRDLHSGKSSKAVKERRLIVSGEKLGHGMGPLKMLEDLTESNGS